jgi:hypothetical protein
MLYATGRRRPLATSVSDPVLETSSDTSLPTTRHTQERTLGALNFAWFSVIRRCDMITWILCFFLVSDPPVLPLQNNITVSNTERFLCLWASKPVFVSGQLSKFEYLSKASPFIVFQIESDSSHHVTNFNLRFRQPGEFFIPIH